MLYLYQDCAAILVAIYQEIPAIAGGYATFIYKAVSHEVNQAGAAGNHRQNGNNPKRAI